MKNYHLIVFLEGDQQAALFGQTCFGVGDVKCTYGTGAFLLMNTGNHIFHSKKGLLTTVAYQLNQSEPACYALEGSTAYAGATIQWLRDNLQLISSAAECDDIMLQNPDSGGISFVPAFGGLFAPYWREDARGIICGLTAFNTKAHVIRAALEAVAFQTKEVVDAMVLDSDIIPKYLKVDGGMSRNELLMQFQCDLLNCQLVLPQILETTALGAAFAAGLAIGIWKSTDDLMTCYRIAHSMSPHMTDESRNKLVRKTFPLDFVSCYL